MPTNAAPAGPTHELPGARFTTLASPATGSTESSVWRLELDPGNEPVTHQVTREEVIVALAGRAVATLGPATVAVGPGDTIVVPAGVDFALAADAGPFTALAVLPVGGQAVVGDGAPFTPPWAQ